MTAHDACQSVDDAVALLKSIGLDITYTDEGLRVIARQIVRFGQRDERARIRAGVDVLFPEWRYPDENRDLKALIDAGGES